MATTSRRPTEAETEILSVLWERGPATVRQVHDVLGPARGVGYTTILKLLQIMADKGWVERDEQQRSHVYRPTVSRADVQAQCVDDMIDRVFGGSTSALIMRALERSPASPDELDEIRKLLDRLEDPR